MEVPDEVFHDPAAFQAYLAQVGGDPRRDGEALVSYLEGWLQRHASQPEEVKQDAYRALVELQAGLDALYAQDIQVARLEDELDMLRTRQEHKIQTLHRQYRGMVFWRGHDDIEVQAAAEWVREQFPAEVAEQILDTSGLLDEDIPDESKGPTGP